MIPPPTAVTNAMLTTPARLKSLSSAISAPEILNETNPIESLMIKKGLFSMLSRL